MRRLIAFLLVAACVVKAVPAEHPAHRRAEDVVDAAAATAWEAGTEAAKAARALLREDRARGEHAGDDREQRARGATAGHVALQGGVAAYVDFRADPAGPGGGGPHAWTAVRLADGWYFLNPTWAAGYVTDGRFVREGDEE